MASSRSCIVIDLRPGPCGHDCRLVDEIDEVRAAEAGVCRAMTALALTTLGVGAADSPRFAPAGLLVERAGVRVMLDGGPGAEPSGQLDAWLVSDDHAELVAPIRRLARARGLEPRMGDFTRDRLRLDFHPVVHTNHLTGGYLIRAAGWLIAWAPEFLEFPIWAAGADLMFAEASAWNRPIRFARGAGGHLQVLAVADAAHAHDVRRLVFAHIGRPAIKAIDRGEKAPFGEFGRDGQVFRLREGGPRRRSEGPMASAGRAQRHDSSSPSQATVGS